MHEHNNGVLSPSKCPTRFGKLEWDIWDRPATFPSKENKFLFYCVWYNVEVCQPVRCVYVFSSRIQAICGMHGQC